MSASLSGSTINITGTPTVAATFASGSVTVTDAAGASVTQTFSITINAAPTIGALTQTTWTQNQSGFTGTMAITGGTTPNTVSAQSGLPAGLTAVVSGSTISFTGTPTALGTFPSGSVTITDAAGAMVTKTFSLTIAPVPTIGSLTLSQWTVNRAGYTGTLPVSDGTVPFTVTASSGLPTSLTATVTGSNVSFTGTPTAAGVFPSGSVTITDTAGASATQTFSITINPAVTIASPTLTQWTVNRSGFTSSLAVSNGTSPYTLTTFSGLPTGMSASLSGSTINITGTPTVAATFASGSVTVTDTDGATGTLTFSITINAAPTVGALTQTAGTIGVSFAGTLPITGGTTPHTVSAQSGLPTGLTAVVSGATISFTGTPTLAGTFPSGSVTITDTAGAVVTKTFSITINPALTVGALTQTQWTVSRPSFPGTLAVSHGTSPFSVTASSGLPTGLTAAVSGSNVVFTGTPSAAGAFPSGSVTVTDTAGATVTQTFSITINPAPTIGTLAPATGTVGQTFAGTMPIAGGTTPHAVTAQSGLPNGLTAVVSGTNIIFTGTPTLAGTFASGSITITDAAGSQATKTVSITISPAPVSVVSIAHTSPAALVTNATSLTYTITFSAAITGLTASNFSLNGSAASAGTIGTPTTNDGGIHWTVPITVTSGTNGTLTLLLANATGLSTTVSNALPFAGDTYTLNSSAAAPAFTGPHTAGFTAGVAGSYQIQTTGTPAPTFWLIGAPSWLFITSSGLLYGTPPANFSGIAQTFTFTIVASNGIPLSATQMNATQTFTLTVAQPRRRGGA
jgi:hypothetical protein